MHSKFVWKFSIVMYLLIHKAFPFTFAEANGSSAKIDATTAKKFAELIRYRIQRGLNWNSTLEPINSILRRAMVSDPSQRISFQQLIAEFGQVYNYYKPQQEAHQLIKMMAGEVLLGGNRQVGMAYKKSAILKGDHLHTIKTPFDDEGDVSKNPTTHSVLPRATPFVASF